MQTNSPTQPKAIRMRCPNCSNYMTVRPLPDGSYSVTCSACHAKIFSDKLLLPFDRYLSY